MVWCKIHILVTTITDGDATSHSEKLQVLFATKKPLETSAGLLQTHEEMSPVVLTNIC